MKYKLYCPGCGEPTFGPHHRAFYDPSRLVIICTVCASMWKVEFLGGIDVDEATWEDEE